MWTVYRLSIIWRNATKNYLNSHTQKAQFVLTCKFPIDTKKKILKTDLVKYRHINLVN